MRKKYRTEKDSANFQVKKQFVGKHMQIFYVFARYQIIMKYCGDLNSKLIVRYSGHRVFD